jgi:hypothetical protein
VRPTLSLSMGLVVLLVLVGGNDGGLAVNVAGSDTRIGAVIAGMAFKEPGGRLARFRVERAPETILASNGR